MNLKHGTKALHVAHLKKHLNVAHCVNDENKMRAIDYVIENFNDVFYIVGDSATFTEYFEHRIPLRPGTNPIHVPQYRIPIAQKDIIDELVENDW